MGFYQSTHLFIASWCNIIVQIFPGILRASNTVFQYWLVLSLQISTVFFWTFIAPVIVAIVLIICSQYLKYRGNWKKKKQWRNERIIHYRISAVVCGILAMSFFVIKRNGWWFQLYFQTLKWDTELAHHLSFYFSGRIGLFLFRLIDNPFTLMNLFRVWGQNFHVGLIYCFYTVLRWLKTDVPITVICSLVVFDIVDCILFWNTTIKRRSFANWLSFAFIWILFRIIYPIIGIFQGGFTPLSYSFIVPIIGVQLLSILFLPSANY